MWKSSASAAARLTGMEQAACAAAADRRSVIQLRCDVGAGARAARTARATSSSSRWLPAESFRASRDGDEGAHAEPWSIRSGARNVRAVRARAASGGSRGLAGSAAGTITALHAGMFKPRCARASGSGSADAVAAIAASPYLLEYWPTFSRSAS